MSLPSILPSSSQELKRINRPEDFGLEQLLNTALSGNLHSDAINSECVRRKAEEFLYSQESSLRSLKTKSYN